MVSPRKRSKIYVYGLNEGWTVRSMSDGGSCFRFRKYVLATKNMSELKRM